MLPLQSVLVNHPFAAGVLGIAAIHIAYLGYWIIAAYSGGIELDQFPKETFLDAGFSLMLWTVPQIISLVIFLIKNNWRGTLIFAVSIAVSAITLLYFGGMF